MDILILDTETSSLDPATGLLLEVAFARYSLAHGLVGVRSTLVRHTTLPDDFGYDVHGIARDLLIGERPSVADAGTLVYGAATQAAESLPIVAWNADFDRAWFPAQAQTLPWVDAMDLDWPRKSTSRSLVATALAHGVGVVSAHRALADVMTMVALFDRAQELGVFLPDMVAKGLRPRAKFQAVVSFDDRDKAKAEGFRWEAETKRWLRTMAVEDAASLPFETREVTR